jgi:hypothetical protein
MKINCIVATKLVIAIKRSIISFRENYLKTCPTEMTHVKQ